MLAPLFNKLLHTKFVQKKHVAAYLVQYARDQGLRKLVIKLGKNIWLIGPKAMLNPRAIVIDKIWNRNVAHLGKADRPILEPFDAVKAFQRINNWKHQPVISIIVPTYNSLAEPLVKMINSVSAQVYPHWELCIADDCSPNAQVREILESYRGEPRIKTVFCSANGGISAASNAAIALSTGTYIGLLDHDDELTPDALYWMVNAINEQGAFDIAYSDECKVEHNSEVLSEVFYKPDFSPETLMSSMYPGHFSVYRKAFLEEKVGYFRSEYDFSQDYDLFLRASARTENIVHIPLVLYKWRKVPDSAAAGGKPFARKTNIAALQYALEERGIKGEALALPQGNRVKLHIDNNTLVSIIIPSDSAANIRTTIASIIGSTDYPNYELLVVTNSRLAEAGRAEANRLEATPPVIYVPYDKPYNFSDKCNVGTASASGEIVVFFNDDVRPMQKDWLENLIEWLWAPGVGGVSPLLLYENDTIQYAGMVTGVRNLFGTAFHSYKPDTTAQFSFPRIHRNVSILSGACMAMRKSLFEEVGGFDAVNTPIAHSDIDLSFKIREQGFRLVFTAYSVLRHIGHLSIGEWEKKEKPFKKDKADIFCMKRWPSYLQTDPYFTRGMKDLLYLDSPEPYDFYAPDTSRGLVRSETAGDQASFACKSDILLVAHELTLSGAPILLYDLARMLVGEGHYVVVTARKGGALLKAYQRLGVPVIIDDLLLEQHPLFLRFARNFDLMICDTVVTWPVVAQLQHLMPTLWWLQESASIQEHYASNKAFVKTLQTAKHVVSVSDYALGFIKPLRALETGKMYNSCDDVLRRVKLAESEGLLSHKVAGNGKLVFSIVGSVEPRKGQDILLEALKQLDPETLEQMEVQIIGRVLIPAFKEKLVQLSKDIGCPVQFFGEQSHSQCLELMYHSDVMISASRDDSFNLVIAEGFCLGKPGIISTHTGIAELMEEGVNGWTFPSGDPVALANRIQALVRHPQALGAMGKNARNTYEQHLTHDIFKKAMLGFIHEKLSIPTFADVPRHEMMEAQ
jgi:GT2 family glycosyltransferase/glycosyltransferase involved in cell wall biosynthesis